MDTKPLLMHLRSRSTLRSKKVRVLMAKKESAAPAETPAAQEAVEAETSPKVRPAEAAAAPELKARREKKSPAEPASPAAKRQKMALRKAPQEKRRRKAKDHVVTASPEDLVSKAKKATTIPEPNRRRMMDSTMVDKLPASPEEKTTSTTLLTLSPVVVTAQDAAMASHVRDARDPDTARRTPAQDAATMSVQDVEETVSVETTDPQDVVVTVSVVRTDPQDVEVTAPEVTTTDHPDVELTRDPDAPEVTTPIVLQDVVATRPVVKNENLSPLAKYPTLLSDFLF